MYVTAPREELHRCGNKLNIVQKWRKKKSSPGSTAVPRVVELDGNVDLARAVLFRRREDSEVDG